MSKTSRYGLALIGTILACAMFSFAQDAQKQKLDSEYQSAVSDYDGGRYAVAAEKLEQSSTVCPRKALKSTNCSDSCTLRFLKKRRQKSILKPLSN